MLFVDKKAVGVTRFTDGRGGFVHYKGQPAQTVAFPDTMIRVRLLDCAVNMSCFTFCWNSMLVRSQVEKSARTTAGIHKINQELLEAFLLPVPGLDEQSAIADFLSEKIAEADQLDQTHATALQQSAALRKSILKKAFGGQLVKQDKNDEPASVLLERIRAEKLNGMKPGKREKSSQNIVHLYSANWRPIMQNQNNPQAPIAIYQTADSSISTEVRLEGESVWLTQKQMAGLFDKNVMTINQHIANVFAEGELDAEATIRKFLIVRQEGKRQVERDIEHYNLDVIFSVGYRVKSKQGTQFRICGQSHPQGFSRQGLRTQPATLDAAC